MKQDIQKSCEKIFVRILQLSSSEVHTASYDTSDNWDSLKHMELIMAIEDQFKIELEEDDMMKMQNFQQTTALIQRKLD